MYGHNKPNATFLFCVIKFKSLEIGQLRCNGNLTVLKKKQRQSYELKGRTYRYLTFALKYQ